MIRTRAMYFGRPVTIVCDGNCRKAWGINSRPRRHLSGDPGEPGIGLDEHCRRADDYVFLGDDALGDAPTDPGTYEGGHAKPEASRDGGHNKWCTRQCERSTLIRDGEQLTLRNLDEPEPNVPRATPS